MPHVPASSPPPAAPPAAPASADGDAAPGAPDPAARERLTRRLVGLAVLTLAFSAGSALLPPRGSADRAPPAPDENAAGVDVQTVSLGGVPGRNAPLEAVGGGGLNADVAPAPEADPGFAATPDPAPVSEPDPPAAPRETPTLQNAAAARFDERSLVPARPVGAPVTSRALPVAATKPAAKGLAPPPAPPPMPFPPAVAAAAPATGEAAWVVQVGVFSTREKAEGVSRQLRAAGLSAPRVEAVQLASGATRYRVRIPTGADAGAARLVQERVNRLPGAFGAAVKSVPAGG